MKQDNSLAAGSSRSIKKCLLTGRHTDNIRVVIVGIVGVQVELASAAMPFAVRHVAGTQVDPVRP
ncbi:MAG: hypothetical protein AAB360_02720 [Patescibacteria group bacterium]